MGMLYGKAVSPGEGVGGRHGNQARETLPQELSTFLQAAPLGMCPWDVSHEGEPRDGVYKYRGLVCKGRSRRGGSKEPIFYFLIACHGWPGNLPALSQGCWVQLL